MVTEPLSAAGRVNVVALLVGVMVTMGGWTWALALQYSNIHNNTMRIEHLERIIATDHDLLVQAATTIKQVEKNIIILMETIRKER